MLQAFVLEKFHINFVFIPEKVPESRCLYIMKRGNICIYLSSIAVFFVALTVSGCGRRAEKHALSIVEDTCAGVSSDSSFLGFGTEGYRCEEGSVGPGKFFSSVLTDAGMPLADAYVLSEAISDVFDVRSLRKGARYQLYYPDDTLPVQSPAYFVYWQDRVNGYAFRCTPPYSAWKVSRPVLVERRYADVTISSSLWNDMLDAGVSPLLIVSLSDIYAWTVDFFGLQKGDRFRVIYDESICDGETVSVDTVRYAVFSSGEDDLPAVMFNQKDGGNIYWNEKGESMRKAFLKAPLKYSRISSGFSYARRHPVTRRVQPHTGVDYAAPAGTPVMAIGDGVVTSVKYEGAGGNVVRIRHNSVYSTAYLHLSRFGKDIRAGARVKQGDVIGYVGSTGRSTGPHLDFRVWKNGSAINPLKMESPPAEPVTEQNMEEFRKVCREYSEEMASLEAMPLVLSVLEHL